MSQRPGNAVLRAVRAHLGFTQREVAALVGMDMGYVCSIETGARRVGHHKAFDIWTTLRPAFDDLGLTQEDLLRGRRDDAAA